MSTHNFSVETLYFLNFFIDPVCCCLVVWFYVSLSLPGQTLVFLVDRLSCLLIYNTVSTMTRIASLPCRAHRCTRGNTSSGAQSPKVIARYSCYPTCDAFPGNVCVHSCTTRLWHLRLGAWLSDVCNVVGRTLSPSKTASRLPCLLL